jgi:hypothetical protein
MSHRWHLRIVEFSHVSLNTKGSARLKSQPFEVTLLLSFNNERADTLFTYTVGYYDNHSFSIE